MHVQTINKKLSKLETSLQAMQQQIKRMSTETQHASPDHPLYCYFNHSIIVHEESHEHHLIIGSFHVKNISSSPMNDPMVLLKIDSNATCDFSGKFKTEHQTNEPFTFLWEKVIIDDVDPHTHFCFKPTNTNTLEPNEQRSFQNFQIKVPRDESVIVEGFTYFNQENDGIAALNSIQLST